MSGSISAFCVTVSNLQNGLVTRCMLYSNLTHLACEALCHEAVCRGIPQCDAVWVSMWPTGRPVQAASTAEKR